MVVMMAESMAVTVIVAMIMVGVRMRRQFEEGLNSR